MARLATGVSESSFSVVGKYTQKPRAEQIYLLCRGVNSIYGVSQIYVKFPYFPLSFCLISTLRILPLMVFGSSSTNSMTRGYL